MWPRFGIKVGNSTFSIAYVKSQDDGHVEIIANDQGSRVSPAVLLADGDEIEVGLTAKQKITSKPNAVAVNSFQLLSPHLDSDEIDKTIINIPNNFNIESLKFELQSQGEEFPMRNLTPYEICVEIFKATFGLARQWHSSVDRPPVVLSVPTHYPEECHEYLARAAEEAGFNVVQVLNEAGAALLAYKIDNNDAFKRVLYIRSGGLLTNFSIYNVEDGYLVMEASTDRFYIGGQDITKALVEFITKEFRKKYGDPTESRRSMAKIQNAAETCKHSLTTLQTTQIYIDSLMDGIDFNMQMSRPRFESIIQPVVNRFMSILNSALETMNTDGSNINEIVLAGGNMTVPAVQSAIRDRFPNATIHSSLQPDEVIAIGCARQSLYVDPTDRVLEGTFEMQIISDDVFIWMEGDEDTKTCVFSKHDALPCSKELLMKSTNPVQNGDDAINKTPPVFCLSTGGEIQNFIPNNTQPIDEYNVKVTAKLSETSDLVLDVSTF